MTAIITVPSRLARPARRKRGSALQSNRLSTIAPKGPSGRPLAVPAGGAAPKTTTGPAITGMTAPGPPHQPFSRRRFIQKKNRRQMQIVVSPPQGGHRSGRTGQGVACKVGEGDGNVIRAMRGKAGDTGGSSVFSVESLAFFQADVFHFFLLFQAPIFQFFFCWFLHTGPQFSQAINDASKYVFGLRGVVQNQIYIKRMVKTRN